MLVARSGSCWSIAALIGELALDLHECDPDVAERVAHRGRIVTEAVTEALDETRDRIDRESCLDEIWGSGAEMDRGQLIEAHHMVGDDYLRGNFGQLSAHVGDGPQSIIDLGLYLVVLKRVLGVHRGFF